MKNYIHGLMLLFLSKAAYGQLEKGKGLLTGSFGASFDQYKFGTGTSKTNQIQAATTVSYGTFFKNNVLLGATIALTGYQTKSVTDQAYAFTVKSYDRSVSITPFARYYWRYEKLLIYAGGGFTLATGRSSYAFDNNQSKGDTRDFSASLEGQAGIIYPVSNRIGVEIYARSSNLPVSINMAGIGLILFTGASSQLMHEDTTTDFVQLSRKKVVLSTSFSTTNMHQTATNAQDTGLVNSDIRKRTTTVAIGVGYFIQDRTQIGISAGYTASSEEVSRSSYVTITPYIRHYMSKTALTPYIGGSVSLQSSRIVDPATVSYSGRLSTGLAYLVGKRFIVEAELISIQSLYSNTAPANDNSANYATTSVWNTSFNATLRPNLMLSYTL